VQQQQQQQQLSPETIAVMRKVADEYADGYLSEFLVPHLLAALGAESDDVRHIRAAFADPFKCLRAFFGHYAFARRGKDRDILAEFACLALERAIETNPMAEILGMPDGTVLWDAFASICVEKRHKSNESQNRGVIQGMLELAQEIYRLDKVGSIAGWILQGVVQTSRLEPQFLRIVDIRGVGPKSTSTFMRDVIFYFGLEDKIEPADRIYVQPVDRWLRQIAQYIVPEPGMDKAADWIIAGKISKYTRRSRISSIRFNMGTTYFGQKQVKDPSRMSDSLASLIQSKNEDPNKAPVDEEIEATS